MSDGQEVLLEIESKVALVTLNRPASMNAFTTSMALEFCDVMDRAVADHSVRTIVITGSGDRSFCVGADLKERNGMTPDQWTHQHKIFEEKNRRVRDCPKPVIGAINGFAMGGGLEIALQMDFLLSADTAKFGQPEVKRGIMPGGGGTQMLPRKVPLGYAMQMLLGGEAISAQEAFRIGLVNAVVSDEEGVVRRTLEVARSIAENSPTAIQQVRRSIRLGYSAPIDTALGIELECYAKMVDHPDRKEGVRAFVEKRTPNFNELKV